LILFLEAKEELEKIKSIIVGLTDYDGIYIRKNAYSSLIESGDFRKISAHKTKQKIVNLYEYYKWIETTNQGAYEKYAEELYPYLQKNFDVTNGTFQNGDIYEDIQFRNILIAYQKANLRKVDKYKSCLIEMNKFLGKREK